MRRNALVVGLLAVLALAGVCAGDGFSSSTAGVTWPLQVATGGGNVAEILGATDQPLWIQSVAGKAVSITAGLNNGSWGDLVIAGGDGSNSGTGGARLTLGTEFGGTKDHGGAYTLAAGGGASGTRGTGLVRGGDGTGSNAGGGLMTVRGGNADGSGSAANLALSPGVSSSGADGSLVLNGVSAHNATALITLAGMTATVSASGDASIGASALTAGTLTVENSSLVRHTVSSFTWTNAQVVALGGNLTGDITVCTLPAKTMVVNAYVVITGAATGPATLTVALGRTSATYVDYIVASDAKAAANTVYGDASGERGANLVGYDLPSYTGTTAVKIHFIATASTLDQTLASTGRVILETALVP